MRHHIVFVLALSLPFFTDTPASAQDPTPDPVVRSLEALDEALREIERTRAWEPLFESTERDIMEMQASFATAQKMVHDTLVSLEDGEDLDPDRADAFHGAMHEYFLDLEELEAGRRFGETETPNVRSKKKLVRAVQEARDMAHEIEGFEDITRVEPSKDADAAELVDFGKRNIAQVYRLVENRTLTRRTSNGTAASRELRAALDAAWQALDELRVEDDEARKERLAEFEDAMDEARIQADYFRKRYLPNARTDAQRRRAELIEERLAKNGFEAIIKRAQCMKG